MTILFTFTSTTKTCATYIIYYIVFTFTLLYSHITSYHIIYYSQYSFPSVNYPPFIVISLNASRAMSCYIQIVDVSYGWIRIKKWYMIGHIMSSMNIYRM